MPELAVPTFTTLIKQISQDFPDFSFIESTRFSWHGGTKHITYKQDASNDEQATYSLLHELGHAVLDHKNYIYDIELVQLEATAWEKAEKIAASYHVHIPTDHIQDCLDTYRDWLHLRSTCPHCFSRSLQVLVTTYHCQNCQNEWRVSRSRLCRPYRLQK